MMHGETIGKFSGKAALLVYFVFLASTVSIANDDDFMGSAQQPTVQHQAPPTNVSQQTPKEASPVQLGGQIKFNADKTKLAFEKAMQYLEQQPLNGGNLSREQERFKAAISLLKKDPDKFISRLPKSDQEQLLYSVELSGIDAKTEFPRTSGGPESVGKTSFKIDNRTELLIGSDSLSVRGIDVSPLAKKALPPGELANLRILDLFPPDPTSAMPLLYDLQNNKEKDAVAQRTTARENISDKIYSENDTQGLGPNDLLSTGAKRAATDLFSDSAMQHLGVLSKDGAIDLTKSAISLALPPGIREVAMGEMQRLAKAYMGSDTPANSSTMANSLATLADIPAFQSHLSNILPQKNVEGFNYNTAAAEILNNLKSIAKDLPEKVKSYIDEKVGGSSEKAPTLAKTENFNQTNAKSIPSSQAKLSSPSPASTLGEYASAEQALTLPKDETVGNAISPSAISWIELARFLTTADGLKVAESKGYSSKSLSEGRLQLELLLSELRAQNSLDLVGILKVPFQITPERLLSKADEVAIANMRAFLAIKPDTRTPTKGSSIKLSFDSPYSLGYVQKETSSVLEAFLKTQKDATLSNADSTLAKIQLINSLTARANVQKVWTFYDARSFQLLKRSQGNLHMVRYMLPFHQASNPLTYLYSYTQKEIGVRNQIAEERRIREGGKARKPASESKPERPSKF